MKLTIPNLLSLLRMGLVPLFIIAVIQGETRRAVLIFVVAGVTDALDGFIARFANQKSLLGAYLDPIADKLLLTSAYVVLAFPNLNHGVQIPVWISVLVIARDVIIVAVVLILYLAANVRKFTPSLLSKLTTAAQVTAVSMVLASAFWPRLETAAEWLLYLVALLTVASFVDYFLRTGRLVASGTPSEPSGPTRL